MITFRTYDPKQHQEACLEVFRSNIPTYFAEKEIPAFIESLNDPDDLFEVVLFDGELIGLGAFGSVENVKKDVFASALYIRTTRSGDSANSSSTED